ncbi:MAG: Nif3-like dinuclear metal center hexameric protein [Solirubrobacteraceae bacterium]|nr:Nif3-like dinuclear metal center hexameric protein [Solirubrobacteraceae bacterium]
MTTTTTTPRDTILAYLDALLEPAKYADYGPNGLQVPGADEVRTVVTGVSANRALIETAVALDADLLLVHHGLFWGAKQTGIDHLMAGRLRPLFKHDISLVAYHLPLDGHTEVGNNALIADGLELTGRSTFAEHGGQPLGIAGTLPGDGLEPDELAAQVGSLCQTPLTFFHGPERIRTVGIVSGGAADDIHVAAALGLDAFITGEPEERSQGAAEEEGIHFLAAGHHATERFGVRRLGDLLAHEFGVAHHFVDIENPV